MPGPAALVAASLGVVLTTVAQTVPAGGTDIQNLITQLGVFGIVVVVFKFMLGRQDSRDEKADRRDDKTLDTLRAEITKERSARAEDRAYFLQEIKNERAKHDAMWEKMVNHQTSESADHQQLVRVQGEIAAMVESLVTDPPAEEE